MNDRVLTTDEAADLRRRNELSRNTQYQSGIAQAQANELKTVRELYAHALKDLARTALLRDQNIPSRQSYNRVHNTAIRAAERLKSIVGDSEQVLVPAWIAPPSPAELQMIEVGAPAVDLGMYRESKGMGKSGAGLPTSGPGSIAWENTAREVGK